MLEMTVGNVLRTAFLNSDGVGKGIVVILILASVFSVSILWNKILTIWQMRKSCNAFLKRYDSVHSPLATGLYLDELTGPLKSVCQIGLREVQEICELNEKRMEQCMRTALLPRKLTQAELDKMTAERDDLAGKYEAQTQHCKELEEKATRATLSGATEAPSFASFRDSARAKVPDRATLDPHCFITCERIPCSFRS